MNKLALLMFGIICFVGCSSASVRTDYDRQGDFSRYSSYDWMAVPEKVRNNPTNSSLMRKRVETAVNANLSAKGMRLDKSSPDLLVTYHAGVKDRVDIDTWGYAYGRRGRFYGTDVDVRQYKEGTLIIDLINAGSKELVWCGIGTGVHIPVE